MRNTRTILLVLQLLLLARAAWASDAPNTELRPAQILSLSSLSLSLSNKRDCLTARAAAERELSLAVMPEIESSFQAQAEPTASTGQDRTRTRTRIGLSYDIASLTRALSARDRAGEECSSQGRGATRLTEEISLLRKRRILAGAAAAVKIYEDALSKARQQRLKLDESIKNGLISLRESDDFSNFLLEIELRTMELQDLIARWTPNEGVVRQETVDFFETETNEKNPDPSRLIQLALAEEMQLAADRAARRRESSWSFRIAGGYEQLSQSQGKPALPGYATAELRYKLGSLWPDSHSHGDAQSASEGNIPSVSQDLSRTLQSEVNDYQRDRLMWQRQYELVRQRSDEFVQRVQLEEAALKSDPHAATRKGMLEISRNRLSLLARAADLGARSGKSASPLPTGDSQVFKNNPSSLVFEVTAGTVESRQWNSPASSPIKEQQLKMSTDTKETPGASENPMRSAGAETAAAGPNQLSRFTASPTMRMHATIPSPQKISLAFRYKGSVSAPTPLAGGDVRNQLGVFLLGKDQCNLLYVMLRFPEPASGESKLKSKATGSTGSEKSKVNLVVQTKINPRQSTHQECGNRGYNAVKPRLRVDLDASALTDGRIHVLTASAKSRNQLEVTLDERVVWTGDLPREFAERLDKPGLIGVRSDNATFEFEASE